MLRRLIVVTLGVTAAVAATSAPAEAIPAFARKYQFSCSTCHAPVPRLKAFGEQFAARGFRLDPAQEPPRATIDTGDPTLRLMRELPIAVRIDGFGSWKEGTRAETDVEWPWAFKVLSGGPITERISYYAYFILEKGGVQGLEDAYLQFNTPFKLPMNLMVGQFQVSDPLFKRELRLERFDYQIFRTRVGLAPADLTYDRGIIGTWAFPGGVDSVLQLVNGNGIREAEGEDFDNDALKTVSWRLSRQTGQVRLGVFSYYGKQRTAAAADVRNRTWYFGPDVVVDFTDSLQLNAQYLERRDDDPFFTGARSGDWETRGGFAELHYLPDGPDGPWVLSLLYNKVDSDDEAARWHSASATVTRLLARNVKVMFEGGREIEHKAGRVSVGVVAAF
jgi:hypothetical protein